MNRTSSLSSSLSLPLARPCLLVVLSQLFLTGWAGAQQQEAPRSEPQAQAPAPAPIVRAKLESLDEIWVGQKVGVEIDLLVPGYFASAASFDIPDPEGVLLFPPAEHPVVGSETIGGVEYTVQKHELPAYPMEPGAQSLPVLTIRFSYKRAALDTEEIPASVTTSAMPFTVKVPPGSEGLGLVISANDLKVSETWKPEPGTDNIKAGTAFTRTVTFTAPEVPGMLFPPFDPGQIDGLGIYTKRNLKDESNRGSLQGKRDDIITYVCKKPGQYVIPAARYTWYDMAARNLSQVDLPSHTLNVVADPALLGSASSADAASDAYAGVGEASPGERLLHWGIAIGAIVAALLMTLAIRRPVARARLATLIAPLRPKHLQPLNPGDA